MERLVIVVEVPDEWREREMLDPARAAAEMVSVLAEYGVGSVRVRWSTIDAEVV